MGIYLFAVIAPFIALWLAVFKPRDPASRNVVWIFCISYGSLFFIAPWSTSDSVRYAARLREMHSDDFGFRDLRQLFFAEGSRLQDLYEPLLTYLVSMFTDQYWLLFAAYAFVFGYFLSRNIWFLVDRAPKKVLLSIVLLIVAFAFARNLGSGINGVRMWTALHIFLFGLFHYFAFGQKRYIGLIALTPLVHFSFWFAVVAFVLSLAAKRLQIAVFVFFLISFGAAYIDIATVRNLMGFIPLPLEDRAGSYLRGGELVMEGLAVRGQRIWFLELNRQLLEAFSIIAASWLMWRKGAISSPLVRGLLVFGMLFYGLINLVAYIPSMGRFVNLAQMAILASVVLFLSDLRVAKPTDRFVSLGLSLLWVINTALAIRFMAGFVSVWILAGNIFMAPFITAYMPLYDALMRLLGR